ncbi:MAG: hypothetical protein KF758_05340 [Anaerolineales bacterium]|nr:hypothetical protein [Anaerolineales bacterium]
MSEQEEFLSPKHKRLLNITIWIRFFAWVMLIFYIVLAILVIPQDIAFHQRWGGNSDYWRMISINRLGYAVDIGSRILDLLLSGTIYYLVLRGVSLGLSMIVETDINYRENQGGHNESKTS